jgi:hypothetical protein
MRDVILKAIENKETVYVKRNDMGQFTDCQNKILSEEELKSWNNHRCLIH